MRKHVINGLPIPPALLAALEDGRWTALAGSPRLERVFGQRPTQAKFLTLPEMVATNKGWENERRPVYVGFPDRGNPPGDIDPANSLIVADLGPDEMIALDYRYPGRPGVVFATADARSPWRHVANSVEDLMRALG
jgi:hypothetical protein